MAETKKRATARKPAAPKKPTLRRKRTAAAPTFEQIQVRAYELFDAGEGGGELEHWLRAERELATA